MGFYNMYIIQKYYLLMELVVVFKSSSMEIVVHNAEAKKTPNKIRILLYYGTVNFQNVRILKI